MGLPGHPPEDGQIERVVFTDERTGLEQLVVCVGARDLVRLKQAILRAFRSAMDEHLVRRALGGKATIMVLCGLAPDTQGLSATVLEMEARLRGIVAAAELTTASGDEIRVSVECFSLVH
jgi:hypothetical protein